ncbi:MAG: endonuclease III [Thermoplasmata archaeon]|nr:endonuclease III [Thermoplasmata archaeon]MCI4359894.1 endonuclease III [Thermoplasmata archaeon]
MTDPKAYPWPKVMDRLSRTYGRGDWRVPYLRTHAEDPFQVLIGTILSQRTRDEATDVASARLFARYPDAGSLAIASPSELEPLIRGTGFYHTKARVLPKCARAILERFAGEVPNDLGRLMTLPGVGPKTANCVVVFGYGLPGMPVDTHVHRIANRLGVVRTDTPEETEVALRRIVPERFWLPLNPVLVQHGQNLCRPIHPKCPECPIVEFCATGIALREGRRPPRPADAPARRRPAVARRRGPGRPARGR